MPLTHLWVMQAYIRKLHARLLPADSQMRTAILSITCVHLIYGDAVNAIDKEYQAKLKESMDIIQKVPDVSPEKIIEAIVAPHKGKGNS